MRFKVANYSRLEIRLDTLHIYNRFELWDKVARNRRNSQDRFRLVIALWFNHAVVFNAFRHRNDMILRLIVLEALDKQFRV